MRCLLFAKISSSIVHSHEAMHGPIWIKKPDAPRSAAPLSYACFHGERKRHIFILTAWTTREHYGLRRSHRQALDPLSIVKPAKRGTVLLAWRLGKVGAPPSSVASTEKAVDNFFPEGTLPRRMEALHSLCSMLKNKTKISPVWDGASTEG
jgi:hypothetical protein